MKILLIDDDPFALELLTDQLAQLGLAEITTHGNAADALSELEGDPGGTDLVFCDLQMPRMDGVEFVRHLARIGYAGNLVLVSGEDKRILQTAEKLANAHHLKILGILHKPVAPAQLRRVLENRFSRDGAVPVGATKSYEPDELRQAITDGDFVNYYQPKVDVASGAVVGVEALVRWRHAHDGLLSPDLFIATAEEHGLIDALTHDVLTEALEQTRLWMDMGISLRVAVNISMNNLTVLEFPDFVARAASRAGVPLTNLVLEVTESQLIRNLLEPIDILTRLRLKHIGLSIDDFGTGHSSLAQLHDLPFDELKVDKRFVHGACRDASLRIIFEACLGMARQMNMRTVAEGVEDRADWNFLRASGCDLAQGNFIAKPMSATDIADWMLDWEDRYQEFEASLQ